jgi:hypothetical protein
MKISRKVKVALGATVASLAIAGSAFAYFTTTGAGTGAGTVGTGTALVIHGTAATALYPGTSSVVTFTADNASTGHQLLNTITLTGVTTNAGHTGCVVADFTMSPVTANQDVPSGTGIAITATGTITMANTAVSQDACKDAVLTLNLTSN